MILIALLTFSLREHFCATLRVHARCYIGYKPVPSVDINSAF